jgi:hypothetical protein
VRSSLICSALTEYRKGTSDLDHEPPPVGRVKEDETYYDQGETMNGNVFVPVILLGPALKKEPRSRKVDKRGTVFV